MKTKKEIVKLSVLFDEEEAIILVQWTNIFLKQGIRTSLLVTY